MNQETPTQDDRIMAALAHGSVVIFGMGIIAAVVLWATQKEKSRYVAFQALQALVYQIAGVVVQIIGWCCWTALYFLSFIPLLAAAETSSDPPLYFLVSMALMVVPFALMGLWIIGGLWGAARTLQGRHFRYLVIGSQLERWLSADSHQT
jgi:uncharacterized Tic20 family protein